MSLAMNLESGKNLGDKFAHEYKGWFVPPATTRYRFYMACDDQCFVKLGTTPGSTTDPTEITYADRASPWRGYYHDTDLNLNSRNKRISDWISLQEGQSYYLESATREHSHGDHFSVGL